MELIYDSEVHEFDIFYIPQGRMPIGDATGDHSPPYLHMTPYFRHEQFTI